MSVATNKHWFKGTRDNLSVSLFGEMTAWMSKPNNSAELPRHGAGQLSEVSLKVINSWLKNWQPAGLEAFQGLSQWKQLGFHFNLITLWKSLVYKHIFLTSHHSHTKPGILVCHQPACLPHLSCLQCMKMAGFPPSAGFLLGSPTSMTFNTVSYSVPYWASVLPSRMYSQTGPKHPEPLPGLQCDAAHWLGL